MDYDLMPESEELLARSRVLLASAVRLLETPDFSELAARETYTAVLQAARAIILLRTGRVAKTHTGTRSEISRLAHEDTRIDASMAGFLARGFDLRVKYDYGTESVAWVSHAEAAALIQQARGFIDHAEWLLAQPASLPTKA